MDNIDNLHNFTFDIEFNDTNINKLDLNKRIEPLYTKLSLHMIDVSDVDNIIKKIEESKDILNNNFSLMQLYSPFL